MFTPADTEALHRLRPMLAAAVSKATNDEEHAVSEVTPEMIHKEKLQKKLFVGPCLKYCNSEFSFSDSLLSAALLAALQQVQMYSATTSGVGVNLIYSDSPDTFSVSAL